MPQQGVNSITVPGAVDGWQKLADKFGRKKLSEDLTAAIRTAQDGFPVPELTAAYWTLEVDLLRTDEAAAKTYLPGDRAPKVGEVFRNPDLAWSLEQIAQHGREAFYKGEIAAKILENASLPCCAICSSDHARSGLRNTSPTFGARSFGRNVLAAVSSVRRKSTSPAQYAAVPSGTGNPSCAVRIAAAKSSASFFLRNLSASFCHPSTAPGTVMAFTPCCGMLRIPGFSKSSIVNPLCAPPPAFIPYILFAFA